MGELAARAEVLMLAHELSADVDRLAFLHRLDEQALAELRSTVTHALFALHEPRLRRIAGLGRLLPVALSAKIAQASLSPMLCGRIAGVLDRDIAIKLAGHFPAPFLAQVSRSIDPARTAEIVRALPDDLVLAVARVLLDEGEYLVLGRFVAVVDERVAGQVIAMASGAQLLNASCYAEDRDRIDALLKYVDDETLADAIRAAADSDLFGETVSLLVFIGPDGHERLSKALLRVGDPAVADGVIRAVVNLEAWDELLPVVGRLSPDAIRLLVNVPTTLDQAVLSRLVTQVLGQQHLIAAARELGYFGLLVPMLDALDDEHRAVLRNVTELDDPELRAFAAEQISVPVDVVERAIEAFRSGTQLPSELLAALGEAVPR